MIIPIGMKGNRIMELDADSLIYRAAFSAQQSVDTESFALYLINRILGEIYEDTTCLKCNIYLGSKTNFRNEIATLYPYKGNRSNRERPSYFDLIRNYLIDDCGAIVVEQQEAEDAVGIEAIKHDSYDDYWVGAIDKDVRMIPGHHYNYIKRTFEFIEPIQALRCFYGQLATGDKGVDNIPGAYHLLQLDGLEEEARLFKNSRYKSKVIKELEQCNTEIEMWNILYALYVSTGEIERHGETRMLEIARLLWIRRYEDELWVPPTQRKYDYISTEAHKQLA